MSGCEVVSKLGRTHAAKHDIKYRSHHQCQPQLSMSLPDQNLTCVHGLEVYQHVVKNPHTHSVFNPSTWRSSVHESMGGATRKSNALSENVHLNVLCVAP